MRYRVRSRLKGKYTLLLGIFLCVFCLSVALPAATSQFTLAVHAQDNNNNGNGNQNENGNGDESSEEVCENKSIFGGVFCSVIDGVRSLINGIYNYILAYARFSLYNPVADDQAGKAGVNQETYDTLKSVWQTFARMASIIIVAAFLVMILASSAAGKS